MLSGRRKEYAVEAAAQALATQAEVMGLDPVGAEDYVEADAEADGADDVETSEPEAEAVPLEPKPSHPRDRRRPYFGAGPVCVVADGTSFDSEVRVVALLTDLVHGRLARERSRVETVAIRP